MLCAAPSLLKRHGIPATVTDLNGLQLLVYTGAERGEVPRYTAPDGSTGSLDLPTAIKSNNGDFLRDAAISGIGLALQPSFIVHRAIEQGSLVPILTDHTFTPVTIHIVYPQTRHVSARARAFIEYARSRIGSKPDWEGFLDR